MSAVLQAAGGRRRRLSTVRARLTLLGSAALAAMLILSALVLVRMQHRLLLAGVDEALKQRVDNIQDFVTGSDPSGVLAEEGDREDSFLQLVDPTGRVVGASANVRGAPAAAPTPAPGAEEAYSIVSGLPISEHEFRVLSRTVQTASGPRTLVAGKNLDDVQGSLHTLTVSMLGLIPPIVIVLALLVWWVTGRALGPVETIRAEVEGMGGSQLDHRVYVPPTNDEVARLARTMNGLLDRIQRATEQQRRLITDVSHELRTPLTRMRSELELTLADPTRAADDVSVLLSDTVELQTLVDDLLFLARGQAGLPPAPAREVDLDDLVLGEAARLRLGGRLAIDTGAVGPARVFGVPDELARVVRNLVANAERHARSTVGLEAREQDGHSVLVVRDDGPGIPAEHRAAIFERFTRLDEARSRDAGGAGLGLAIVKDIVGRHGGEVRVAASPSGGAQFTVTLPRAQ